MKVAVVYDFVDKAGFVSPASSALYSVKPVCSPLSTTVTAWHDLLRRAVLHTSALSGPEHSPLSSLGCGAHYTVAGPQKKTHVHRGGSVCQRVV